MGGGGGAGGVGCAACPSMKPRAMLKMKKLAMIRSHNSSLKGIRKLRYCSLKLGAWRMTLVFVTSIGESW